MIRLVLRSFRVVRFYLVCALFLIHGLFAIHVVDEGSKITIKSGEQKKKYVSLYNISDHDEFITVSLVLEKWPNKKKPSYQIDLATIQDQQVIINPNKRFLFPVYLDAASRLEPGEYIYWLDFQKEIYKARKEGVDYQESEMTRVPLILKIKS